MTFDAWEGGVYCPDDVLMHWGIPGMKHGRRRYQNEDGTWTEQGLAERRKREGFGESRAERKAERKAARADRKEARRAAKVQALEEWTEKRRQKNVKNLTDDEIKAKIARLKLEQEYKELSKSPLLKMGETLFNTYMEAQDKKIDREEKKVKLENDRINALKELTKAQAQKKEATNEFISQISGTSRKKAKAELKKVKNEERKNTIRGAISSGIGNIIRKEGSRFVKDMDDSSLMFRAGRRLKKGATAAKASYNNYINNMAKSMSGASGTKKRKRK